MGQIKAICLFPKGSVYLKSCGGIIICGGRGSENVWYDRLCPGDWELSSGSLQLGNATGYFYSLSWTGYRIDDFIIKIVLKNDTSYFLLPWICGIKKSNEKSLYIYKMIVIKSLWIFHINKWSLLHRGRYDLWNRFLIFSGFFISSKIFFVFSSSLAIFINI